MRDVALYGIVPAVFVVGVWAVFFFMAVIVRSSRFMRELQPHFFSFLWERSDRVLFGTAVAVHGSLRFGEDATIQPTHRGFVTF